VPELPDLAVLAEAFEAALAGRRIRAVGVVAPLTARATPAELDGLVGQTLLGVARRGKFLRFVLDRDEIIVNLMLSGRLALAATTAEADPRDAAAVLDFSERGTTPSGPPSLVRASWLPAAAAAPRLTLLDRRQMAKLYVVGPAISRRVAGFDPDELGPDADDPGLTLDAWRARIRRHSGQLKPLLRNQRFVAGIGNAYADEILHAARLQPFRRRASLAPDEIDELYEAMRTTIGRAIEILRERVPPTFERQVRDFFAVHGRGGESCPRCGGRISEVGPGDERTAYCRGCQR
jgi:formamidopyrimidine-DNA glycosylase